VSELARLLDAEGDDVEAGRTARAERVRQGLRRLGALAERLGFDLAGER
jgi:hypothetical protein